MVAANELMVAREAVTVAVLKRDPASLLEALCMFDNERQAVFVAVDAVARANTATRQWWAAREKEGADA